jgi:hypothetical protein
MVRCNNGKMKGDFVEDDLDPNKEEEVSISSALLDLF